MVHSQIIKANGEPVKVDYVMRRNGEGWLISDIYLDGAISEVATRRSEFAAILKNDGIDGLNAALNPPRRQISPKRFCRAPGSPTGRRSFGTRVIQLPQDLWSERTWKFKSPARTNDARL
jgi:hypothetical protein